MLRCDRWSRSTKNSWQDYLRADLNCPTFDHLSTTLRSHTISVGFKSGDCEGQRHRFFSEPCTHIRWTFRDNTPVPKIFCKISQKRKLPDPTPTELLRFVAPAPTHRCTYKVVLLINLRLRSRHDRPMRLASLYVTTKYRTTQLTTSSLIDGSRPGRTFSSSRAEKNQDPPTDNIEEMRSIDDFH